MSERERDDDEREERDEREPEQQLDRYGRQTVRALDRLEDREPGFMPKLEQIAERLGTRVEWLINVMMFESSLDASRKNPRSTATGLIQFMARTARALGTSVSALRRMSATRQLDWVERYFRPFRGRLTSQAAVYAAVAGGRVGTDQSVLFRRGSREYRANRVWDTNRDGRITQGELGRLAARYGAGTQFEVGDGDDRRDDDRESQTPETEAPEGAGAGGGGGERETETREAQNPQQPRVRPGHIINASVGRRGDNERQDVGVVQELLAARGFSPGNIDRLVGPKTIGAIRRFQRTFMRHPDGLVEVGKITERQLMDASSVRPPQPRREDDPDDDGDDRSERQPEGRQPQRDREEGDDDRETSARGAQQMSRLLSEANDVDGRRPRGKCYRAVKHHIIDAGGYGNIRNIYTDPRFAGYQAEAKNFASRVNQNPDAFGLERLSISNPYDAPQGSIVVVGPGSPGTRHPTAGDITVRGPGDNFYNDGDMNYQGREAWPPRRGGVLGVYKPK